MGECGGEINRSAALLVVSTQLFFGSHFEEVEWEVYLLLLLGVSYPPVNNESCCDQEIRNNSSYQENAPTRQLEAQGGVTLLPSSHLSLCIYMRLSVCLVHGWLTFRVTLTIMAVYRSYPFVSSSSSSMVLLLMLFFLVVLASSHVHLATSEEIIITILTSRPERRRTRSSVVGSRKLQ